MKETDHISRITDQKKGDMTDMNDKVTISLFELAFRYPTDDSARIFLEEQHWHGMPVCSYCGTLVNQHKHHHKGEQGYYHCSTCNQVYTVRTGTICEDGSGCEIDTIA